MRHNKELFIFGAFNLDCRHLVVCGHLFVVHLDFESTLWLLQFLNEFKVHVSPHLEIFYFHWLYCAYIFVILIRSFGFLSLQIENENEILC